MRREIFDRTIRLIGEDAASRLARSSVLVFGLGGVGSYVCEGLARAGVGRLALVDNDTVAYSNINRQLFALTSTIGKEKTAVARLRLLDINPSIEVETHTIFFDNETADRIDLTRYDYIVDAIDSIKSKVLIAKLATAAGIPIIASMGTGYRLDPLQFRVTDIYKTEGCALSRQMRKQLKREGISALKVVYSTEPATSAADFRIAADGSEQAEAEVCRAAAEVCRAGDGSEQAEAEVGRVVASISYVPPVAGLLIVSEVIKDIIAKHHPPLLYPPRN